ncbi:RNA-binding cell elongation regulator Jag/EloR [Pontibacillus litoralis]|uniref:RNA-binding protein KhpB n=1 Tax=Pontibacillus litoralis JSM 072002 TaxID=1385512 RepID=A0A0A5HPX7_9BACI|nr:RNA-binding cell elongation regulator Jag/EloR [Pontibacillus litoralis]KGX85682.1 protein jag [Pontibacillus litoralis JSM 072002]
MRQVTATGQTVEQAVQSALEQLNISRDRVDVEIIDEGKKGLFGIFGTKPAIVKVRTIGTTEEKDEQIQVQVQTEAHKGNVEVSSITSEPQWVEQAEELLEDEKDNKESDVANCIEETKQYLIEVAAGMGAPIDVHVHRKGKEIVFELVGSKIALLIGKRGQTLNALQYLSQIVLNRTSSTYLTAIVDAENYRMRRKETLTKLANRLADQVARTKKGVALEAMPSYERKIIHSALQHHKSITTFSDGTDPHRHVVIKPK